ncbi:type II toxin-antitoxin system RelE/ParE family toxin [Halalkalibacillus halophilus]|uniref:type II toxin-antitoxin system RelE/ParE family toxin n=1 Tax=Halalkalibacillus halophilus TaxID=392827 RepID=UPI0005541F07
MKNGDLIRSGEVKRKDIKPLRSGIWQLRVKDDRVLFFYFSSDSIVLTNQFKKKSNETPKNQIERAIKRQNEWMSKHNKQ